MNGITEITVGGEKYPLLYGRAAAEEIAIRIGRSFTANSFKNNLDLIYAGLLNHAIKHDNPIPEYEEVYSLVEAFHDEEDAKEQIEKISGVYAESKWGRDFLSALEEAKKKVEKELEAMMGTTESVE